MTRKYLLRSVQEKHKSSNLTQVKGELIEIGTHYIDSRPFYALYIRSEDYRRESRSLDGRWNKYSVGMKIRETINCSIEKLVHERGK